MFDIVARGDIQAFRAEIETIFITMRQRLKLPMDKALLTLRNLKAKIFDDEIVLQEASKKTKEIMKALNIIMPTSLGI